MRDVLPYAAYLRVYEPLAAFPDDEREHWAAYAAAGKALSTTQGPAVEHADGLAALLAVPARPAPPEGAERAFVRVVDGITYVCPWRTRLRCWEALAEFRRGLPDQIADAFVARPVADDAESDYARWLAAHPTTRPSILTSTWQVPVPWFVLFESSERRMSLGANRSLVYLTAMSRARQRLARALAVVKRTFEEGPATAGIEELGRWLEEFHPHAFVELDYSGLVHLVDDGDLSGDSSVAEVTESLAALAAGDMALASENYERLTSRWRRMAAFESAN